MELRPYDHGLDLEEQEQEEQEDKTMISFTYSVSSDNDGGGKVNSATKECDDVGSTYKNDDLCSSGMLSHSFIQL